MAKKPRTPKGYIRRYAGSVRDELPALLKKGWSGKKILSHLRRPTYKHTTDKRESYHLSTQAFYDIRREFVKVEKYRPAIKRKPADVLFTDTDTVLTTLDLSLKYRLFIEYDIRYASGRLIERGMYNLNLAQLPTQDEAISMVHARMITKLKQSPKRDKIKRFYSNYRVVGIWKRSEFDMRRKYRGERSRYG